MFHANDGLGKEEYNGYFNGYSHILPRRYLQKFKALSTSLIFSARNPPFSRQKTAAS